MVLSGVCKKAEAPRQIFPRGLDLKRRDLVSQVYSQQMVFKRTPV
jgi:hypothetical protein